VSFPFMEFNPALLRQKNLHASKVIGAVLPNQQEDNGPTSFLRFYRTPANVVIYLADTTLNSSAAGRFESFS